MDTSQLSAWFLYSYVPEAPAHGMLPYQVDWLPHTNDVSKIIPRGPS